MIYYLRPEQPTRLLKSATVKLEPVGQGKDLNIYYVTVEESINSDLVKAQATKEILHCYESIGNETPKNLLSISSQQSEDMLDGLKGPDIQNVSFGTKIETCKQQLRTTHRVMDRLTPKLQKPMDVLRE